MCDFVFNFLILTLFRSTLGHKQVWETNPRKQSLNLNDITNLTRFFLFCSVLLCLFYRSVSIATVLLILLFYSFIICLPICSFLLCWWLHCVIAFAFFCFVLFALMYREVNKHACVFVFVWVRVYKSWILRLRIAWSLSFSLVVFVISSWVCFCLKTFMRDEILAKYAKLCGILTISLPSVCMCVCVTFVFINIYFILTTCSLRRR